MKVICVSDSDLLYVTVIVICVSDSDTAIRNSDMRMDSYSTYTSQMDIRITLFLNAYGTCTIN